MDIEEFKEVVEGVVGVYIEMLNFFGLFEENIREIGEIVYDVGVLFVVGVDFMIFGIVEVFGEFGVDIVVGEVVYFGNLMNFGGLRVGIFVVRNDRKLIR